MNWIDISHGMWRRRSRVRVPLLTFVVLIAACSGTTTPSGSSVPGETSSSSNESPGSIFGPADPIDVDVVLDTDNMVEALIPVEGGSVTTTGADGTVYTLDIPSDALLNETTIGLTPVTRITGMPFGGEQPHAVQLSPDGLSLFNFAILTILPAEEIPLEEQIFFGYLGEGSDLVLAAPVVDSSEIKFNVLHFSGNGITRGIRADLEGVRERLGGDAERRLQSAIGETLAIERQRQLLCDGCPSDVDIFEVLRERMREFDEQVVRQRVAAAGESCAAGRLAMRTLLGIERQRQLLGVEGEGEGLARYLALMDPVGRICAIEEFELCVQDHVIHRMLPFWLGLRRENELLGGGVAEGAIREARELTVLCLTFRLELESTGTAIFQGAGSWESSVTSEVTLRFDPDELKVKGAGEYINTDYELQMDECSAAETPGGGSFDVYELRVLTAKPDQFSDPGFVTDDGLEVNFLMAYFPGISSERAIVTCPSGPGVPPDIFPFDAPAWSVAFLDAHVPELVTEGLIAIDWEVHGGELYAEKEWDLVGAADPLASEEGNFKLFHTPGA